MRQEPGLAPAGDLLFLLVQAKKAKEHDPTVRVPTLRFTSLRANLRHAIQTAVRQNSLRSKLLRSNTLPLVSSRSNAVLRQRCPQPEQRATGADTRVDTGTGGQREL